MLGPLARLDIALSRLKERWRLPCGLGDDTRPAWRRVFDAHRLPPRLAGHAQQGRLHRHLTTDMCQPCAWRWEVGRPIRHWTCERELENAIEAHFARPDYIV